MNLKNFILLCLFIISRIIFINPLPVFFDSPEYLMRFSNPNYFQAIISGHIPFHAGYIILFWPIFHASKLFGINPSFTIIFAQIIFSAIAIYCLYRFIGMITNDRIAVISTAISSLVPLYWIMNVSIMTESTYINSFLISLFFLSAYAKNKLKSNSYLIFGCALLSLSLLTNLLVILWIPFLLSIIYFLKKERFIAILLSVISAIFLAVLVNSFFISYAFHTSFQNGIHQYLFGEDIKIAPSISSITAILRFVRNAFVPILQNNTSIVVILSIISFLKLFKKNKKLFIIVLLWILPTVITNQWFDPLLFGRHGTISGFGFAFLAAILLEKKKIIFLITATYILIVSIPALSLLKQPIPYLEMSNYVKTLPKGLLIETHFARPQIEGNYSGKIIFINQPGWNPAVLGATIDKYLNENEPIFVTSQALTDPYGIYSGPYLYPLSLSYINKPELYRAIGNYSLKKYAAIDDNAEITIYRIILKEKSRYPDIPQLNFSQRQISFFDPLNQLWLLIERANIIQSHSIING